MSNTERELLDIQLKNSIKIARSKTSEKTYSQLPRGVRITIDEILLNNKPIVDWRRVLRLFSESSVKTKIRNTLKKASKRYGTTPGLKIVQRHKILVVLDTSGSILQDELKDFFSEVRFMWKRGAEVYIVECDSVIHKKYWYKGVHPNVVYGGGGTSFDLPLKFANEEFHPDAIVYFTDGIAMPPTIVSKAPILWVISKNGIAIGSEHFTNLKGRKAKIL
jgi:predicted metal-dependent peptidase